MAADRVRPGANEREYVELPRSSLYFIYSRSRETLTSIDRSEPWPMLQQGDRSRSWESLEVPPPEFSAVDSRNPIDRLCPQLTRGSITYGFKNKSKHLIYPLS